MIRRLPAALIVGVLAMLLVGASCPGRGTTPPPRVERDVAARGINVLQALDEVGEQAKRLYGRQVLTAAQYRTVLERVITAHELASDLADVLLVVDQGGAALTQAQGLLEELLALAPRLREGLDGEALDAITKAVGRVETALETVETTIAPERKAA